MNMSATVSRKSSMLQKKFKESSINEVTQFRTPTPYVTLFIAKAIVLSSQNP